MHGLRGVSRYRTLWISDTHLGTRGCQADYLLDCLRHTQVDTLFLVGDIIDGWRLKKSWYWTETQNAVVQEILRKSQAGTKVIYIPGNHDECLRDYTSLVFGGVLVADEAIHVGADGRRFLVLHGDEFDSVVRYAKWLAHLGDWAYTGLLSLNVHFNHVRRWLKLPYWSLSAYIKHRVKNAVEFISHFETAVADEARKRGVDGVICGHIHHPEMRMIGDILYCNDGDWVESCTALVEHGDGQLEILRWTDMRAPAEGRPRSMAAPLAGLSPTASPSQHACPNRQKALP